MRRDEAVRAVIGALGDELCVVCNGMIGREAFTAKDREKSFYMIGSMGLGLSIGLGLALSRPKKRVVVLDGDGNVLMGAGVLASVGHAQPENLLHVCLDNEAHASTGDQKTITDRIRLEDIAKAAGYRSAERVPAERLAERLPSFLASRGPAFLLCKVERGNVKGIARQPRRAGDGPRHRARPPRSLYVPPPGRRAQRACLSVDHSPQLQKDTPAQRRGSHWEMTPTVVALVVVKASGVTPRTTRFRGNCAPMP